MSAEMIIGPYWKEYISGKPGSNKPVVAEDVVAVVPQDANSFVKDVAVVTVPHETAVFIRGANPLGAVAEMGDVEFQQLEASPDEETILFVLSRQGDLIKLHGGTDNPGTEAIIKHL